MAKKNGSIVYKCASCGFSQGTWLGRCPDCGEWNSFEECVIDSNAVTPFGRGSCVAEKIKPVPLSSVKPQDNSRYNTGICEFDRVLGGGATKRSAILIGGEPGIGKSTLLIQTASAMAKSFSSNQRTSMQNNRGMKSVSTNQNEKYDAKILYVSGEESSEQIKERAERLGLCTDGIQVLCTMRLEDVLEALDNLKPLMTIVDSIQTIYSVQAGIVPGTLSQLKYCANELVSWVKERDSVLIMTAHVTKEGTIAGPKTLEHMVDTVISFERNNDDVRFLHAQKNRFGSVDELGIFNMTEKGLIPVLNPATMFLSEKRDEQPAGVACTAVFEGNRVFLVEIQALTTPAKASISRVFSDKIEASRVSRIAAILEKRAGINFSGQDIYINVAGGIKLSESAIDGALACAIYSARTDIPTPVGTAVFGELSLAGEIRSVPKIRQRAKTAENLGFTHIFSPEKENGSICIKDIKSMIKEVFKTK